MNYTALETGKSLARGNHEFFYVKTAQQFNSSPFYTVPHQDRKKARDEWFKMLDEILEKEPSQRECVKRLADLAFSLTHVDTVLKGGSSDHTSLLRAITLLNRKTLWLYRVK